VYVKLPVCNLLVVQSRNLGGRRRNARKYTVKDKTSQPPKFTVCCVIAAAAFCHSYIKSSTGGTPLIMSQQGVHRWEFDFIMWLVLSLSQ
jgi:hypothetical protein